MLPQEPDGEEKVIGYFSKVLSKPEQNYCVTQRELLAVVKSISHFHKYLYGRNFLLRADHTLMWLLRFKSPEGQVAQWIESLQKYDFEAVYPDLNLVLEEVCRRRPIWQSVAPLSPHPLSLSLAQWDLIVEDKGILNRVLENAARDQQVIVPRKRVPEVLRQLHDGASGGQFGVHKTLYKVRERFYWPNLKEDVKSWCRSYTRCATTNDPVHRKRAPIQKCNVGAPFERITFDIAGPFSCVACWEEVHTCGSGLHQQVG